MGDNPHYINNTTLPTSWKHLQLTHPYASAHPQPEDVLFIIEIADSSLAYDREVKAALYAEAGIGHYWLVNLRENCVEVYAQPADNRYLLRRIVRPEDALPLEFPPITSTGADFLI